VRQHQQADAAEKARQEQAAVKAAKAQADAAAADEKQRLATANKLRTDPVFSTILGPDGRDITVLVVGGETASVVRNLKGEPVFQKGAIACMPFGWASADADTPNSRFLVDVRKQFEQKFGLINSSLLLTTCDPASLGNYPLIVFTGAQIANGAGEILGPLADSLRRRQFVLLHTYAIADFVAAEAARAEAAQAKAMREEAERNAALASFAERDASVVSLIHVEAPASVVCVASSPDPDGVRYLLKRAGSPFAGTVTPASVTREYPSSDAIFIAIKRKECTAAAAPAGMLKDVMAGLIRDGFKVEVDKGLISAEALAAWKTLSAQELAQAQDEQKRALEADRLRQEQRKIREAEQRKLDDQRRHNDEYARREELDRMQKQVASKATAVMEDFTRKVQKHFASLASELNDTRQRAKGGHVLTRQEQAELQSRYANDRISLESWPSEVETMLKEGWEFNDPKTALEDYGRAQWKERTIEAITVRMEFPIVNRVIGERKLLCKDITWINDEEFQFTRQMQVVSCDDYQREFAIWSQANGFVSQWKLLQPAG
jgi:hypothetical protein